MLDAWSGFPAKDVFPLKTLIAAALLLALTSSAFAAERTVTPAQWKDIHELYYVFGKCGGYDDDPELKETCARSVELQKKLEKQGFCFHKRLIVGRLAWHGPEEDRVKLWPKGEKQCYVLHDPAL